jgi:hypothetical protein
MILAGQAARAEATMEQAAVDVAKAACAVLLEEGAKQGLALKKIWEELSRQRDRVTAFADCQIYYANIPFPITLPSETANLRKHWRQSMAAKLNIQMMQQKRERLGVSGSRHC